MRIFKFQFTDKTELRGEQGRHCLSMPIGSKVICFMNQNDIPTIWAEVDEYPDMNENQESRHFFIV